MKFLRLALTTLRLAILRIGPGWMFGLLTFNFNRIAIHEFGAIALIIATLIGLHHFISPLQVMWGHLADRYPLLGYRRTPYVFLSGLMGSIVFLLLPWLTIALGDPVETQQWVAAFPGQISETALAVQQIPGLGLLIAFLLLVLFGVAMAANGNSAAALVAETIEEKHRGTVFVVVWMFMIFTSIASAGATKAIMPEYDPVTMQSLYNLTLPIVLISSLIGLVGLERRITPHEHAKIMAAKRVESSSTNAFVIFWRLFQSNPHVRRFFLFVLFAIFGIFLQDAILEVFGAEVFAMSPGETAGFTQSWGQGMLIGLVLVVIFSQIRSVPRKTLAIVGGLGIALSLQMIAISSLTFRSDLVTPSLVAMGISTGLFNVGALSLMMEMTVEGHAGLYMGMWGFSQGLGNGLANMLSGGLHTVLIETELFSPSTAYGLIYSAEAWVMVGAILLLRTIHVREFKGLSRDNIKAVMALDTTG
jgi:BCD family chlorophyll transporter-like MFS transporter